MLYFFFSFITITSCICISVYVYMVMYYTKLILIIFHLRMNWIHFIYTFPLTYTIFTLNSFFFSHYTHCTHTYTIFFRSKYSVFDSNFYLPLVFVCDCFPYEIGQNYRKHNKKINFFFFTSFCSIKKIWLSSISSSVRWWWWQ